MMRFRLPNLLAMERLPWAARAGLGCCAAGASVALTYSVHPLRPFPLLLAFPTVILSAWFLGMWGGVSCALVEAVLVDTFLTRAPNRFSIGSAPEQVRMGVFLTITIVLGWAIRRLAEQRAELGNRDLEQRLGLATAERLLAEQRAQASRALRERDDLLQIALKANGMGLWVWDLATGVMHRSDEMLRMVGREPGSVGSDPAAWLAFVHPADVDTLVTAMHRTRYEGADYRLQYRVVWPDGSVHWLESQGKCQRGVDGLPARLVGVIAEVTHRKLAEEAMLRAEKLAVAGRLAASVAHEINNPLEAMANLLYLVTTADELEPARQLAGQAMEQLMRVSQITQQTLKFHRQVGSPRPASLAEVLGVVLDLFNARLAASQIAVELSAEREAAVECMPTEMQQVFANLIGNAVDAMPRGGRLRIRLRPSLDWRDGCTEGMRATFADSGSGMDRATLRRIFEPFFTTKPEIGTGLGLWVVAQLVERHKGQVRVWSSQRSGASGTVFSVFVPARGLRENPGAPAPAGEVAEDRALIEG